MLDGLCSAPDQTWSAWAWTMSYLDVIIIVAFTAFGIYLAANNTPWAAPVSMIGFITLAMVCYTSKTYGDFFLQIYFFIGNIWLLAMWNLIDSKGRRIPIKRTSTQLMVYIFTIWVLGSYILGANIDAFFILIVRMGLHLITVFDGEPHVYLHRMSVYPYLEAFAIIGQLMALVLMVYRHIANWYMWILINIVCIVMFALRGNFCLTSVFLLYALISVYGVWKWEKIYSSERTLK